MGTVQFAAAFFLYIAIMSGERALLGLCLVPDPENLFSHSPASSRKPYVPSAPLSQLSPPQARSTTQPWLRRCSAASPAGSRGDYRGQSR